MDTSLSKLREMVKDRESWHAAIHGVAKSQARLSDWTELNKCVGSDWSTDWPFPQLSLSLRLHCFLGHTILRLGRLITLWYPTKCSSEKRGPTHVSHFKSKPRDDYREGNTTHSSVLAWRIPGTGDSGGLPSMGSHRVGLNWSDLAAAAEMIKLIDGAML